MSEEAPQDGHKAPTSRGLHLDGYLGQMNLLTGGESMATGMHTPALKLVWEAEGLEIEWSMQRGAYRMLLAEIQTPQGDRLGVVKPGLSGCGHDIVSCDERSSSCLLQTSTPSGDGR